MCPDTTLLMADRLGVEVDYCPQCRGLWLDRGELDKLLALDARHAVAPTAPTGTRTGARMPRASVATSKTPTSAGAMAANAGNRG
jgi:Zn-finger nucleic acid-binding protein